MGGEDLERFSLYNPSYLNHFDDVFLHAQDFKLLMQLIFLLIFNYLKYLVQIYKILSMIQLCLMIKPIIINS